MNTNTATVSSLYPIDTNPSGIHAGKKMVEGISVVEPEQVSPLLALPNELLFEIANYLPFGAFCRLSITSRRLSIVFNTKERLKKLADHYYGPAAAAYRATNENRIIPAVPSHDINDRLSCFAYFRWISNQYLALLGNNAGETCVMTLNGHTDWVNSVTPLADGRLASGSDDKTVKVWDLSKPDEQQCVAT
ncbi:F-box/WD40 repeat-containing protein [Endozoicomonas sp. ONNA2]|uniref:F-box/WD repeat-containing protein n=1 Tax=Endozoicomonas sp. ONNA2 TaxID=2828741 RepID=UPI00214919F6|nr:F-box/WD40 repeat-containing protein [Endozoicomonas sp. ONNA2]